MDMKSNRAGLSLGEEAFLQALLWEEGHMLHGAATRAAEDHGLSLLSCLEVANHLSPNLHGAALNEIRRRACPSTDWPWGELNGEQALRLLWRRLTKSSEGTQEVQETGLHS